MAAESKKSDRDGRPYIRLHKGYWHLYYPNPDPEKNYPVHRSLRLPEEKRDRSEAIEAEAQLLWRECEEDFEEDPGKIEEVFGQFVEDKIRGRERQSATAARSDYLEKTFDQVLEEFLASKQSKAKRTRDHYRSHIRQIRRLMECDRPASNVRPEDIREFLKTRIEEEEIHKKTANKYLITLRSVFYFAQRHEYVEKNPARIVESFSLDPEDKEELSDPVYIPPEAFDALVHSKAARDHPPVRYVIFILYHTGMRIGELLRLRWRDIDLDGYTMHVTASPQKGGDRNPYMVSRQLRLFFRFARREAEQRSGSASLQKTPVLPNPNGNTWDYSNLYSKIWTPFLNDFAREEREVFGTLQEAAEVEDSNARPISFHDFRHTFITDMLTEGFNPIVVGWLVGHKELHTQRRYTHLCYSHFVEEFQGFKR